MVSCKSKGQASLEYLVIFGIALVLLLPIMGMFYTSTLESANLNKANLMVMTGRSLSSNAENVYYQGKGSKVRIDLNVPDNVDFKSVNTTDFSEIVISSEFDGLLSEFVFFTDVNFLYSESSDPCGLRTTNGAVLGDSGTKTLFVESCGKYVVVYAYED